MNFKRLLIFLIALAALDCKSSAHHSTVAYAQTSIVLKSATVTKLVWGHPHSILTFTIKDAKGAVTTWSAESGSPGSLARFGWNRNSVKAGDSVTIELFPSKNGAHVGRLKKVIFPNGQELLDSQTNQENGAR
jgi:hypothetical protein